MITLLDMPFAKVWIDETIPCLYTHLQSCTTGEEVETVLEKEQLGARLASNRSAQVFSVVMYGKSTGDRCEELVNNYLTGSLARHIPKFFTSRLIIMPPSDVLFETLCSAIFRIRYPNTEIVESFDQALHHINRVRSGENQEVSKTSPSSLGWWPLGSKSG